MPLRLTSSTGKNPAPDTVQEASHPPRSLPDWTLLEGRAKHVSIPARAQGLAWSGTVEARVGNFAKAEFTKSALAGPAPCPHPPCPVYVGLRALTLSPSLPLTLSPLLHRRITGEH